MAYDPYGCSLYVGNLDARVCTELLEEIFNLVSEEFVLLWFFGFRSFFGFFLMREMPRVNSTSTPLGLRT